MSSKSIVHYRSHPFNDRSLVKERNLDAVAAFEQHLRSGDVDTLLCFGTNIIEQAPVDVDVRGALKFVKDKVHLIQAQNELSEISADAKIILEPFMKNTAAAITLARDSNIPIIVFSIHEKNALAEVISGSGSHTIINSSGSN